MARNPVIDLAALHDAFGCAAMAAVQAANTNDQTARHGARTP